MNANDFIRIREKDWQRLEHLVKQHQGRRPLTAEEVRELGQLYRAVTSDLALARRDYPKQRITVYLNQLLTRVHNYIYQEDISDIKRLVHYFLVTIPQTYRRLGKFTLISFLMFMIAAIIGFTMTYTAPDTSQVLGLSEQQQMLANQSTWTDIEVEERPYVSAFIMSNNIYVTILAFGGGVAFGLFTFYAMVFNGLHIGAILGLAAHYGMDGTLVDFIFAHGVVELSVIFMAGGAGLSMGWALLNPGLYSRKDALAMAARQAIPLIVIAVPLLIMAGIIEGFVSPSDAPFATKVMVGLGTGALIYGYFFLLGRPKVEKPQRKTISALRQTRQTGEYKRVRG